MFNYQSAGVGAVNNNLMAAVIICIDYCTDRSGVAIGGLLLEAELVHTLS